MNRLSFLRNFLVASVSLPSVLAEVGSDSIPKQVEKFTKVKEPKSKLKLAIHLKISDELLNDEKVFIWFIKNHVEKYRIFNEGKEYYFDLSKPYELQLGLENDDFIRNLKTCLLTQYIER